MNRMDPKEQRKIGRKAKAMVQSSLKGQIRLNHLTKTSIKNRKNKNGEDISSLVFARAESRIRHGNLAAIAIVMGRHGFIQHSGVNRQRTGGTVHRTKPTSIFYQRKSHQFNLTAKPFLTATVDQSGAVPYISRELGQLAGNTIIQQINFS